VFRRALVKRGIRWHSRRQGGTSTMNRNANAVWKGSGPEGQGPLPPPAGPLPTQPYSAKLRFQGEDGKAGTNPEELIAAAHASCFSMALAFQLTKNQTPPEQIDTEA